MDTKAANFPRSGLSGHVRAVRTMEDRLAGRSDLLDTEDPCRCGLLWSTAGECG